MQRRRAAARSPDQARRLTPVSLGRVRDQGLGASGTGITKHLALVKRQDQTGVFAGGVAALACAL